MCNVVSDIKRRTQTENVCKEGAEDNIWIYEDAGKKQIIKRIVGNR